MKRITVCLVAILLLLMITIAVQAQEDNSKGDLTVLAGKSPVIKGSYYLTDKLRWDGDAGEFSGYLENKHAGQRDYFFRTDLHYQISDWFGVKFGARYDSTLYDTTRTDSVIPYGGFDFFTPFGTSNLRFTGYYNYNFEGKDWADYEVAWRIEMYPNQYLYAGVRGDAGDGFAPYDYNKKNDPLFFLRGDYNWQWGKFGINFRPLLYATGYVVTDTSFKYQLSDRTDIILNVSDYYDRDMKYRLGFQHKF